MAGAGDIRAGRAFVELTLRDSAFLKGLRGAGTKLKALGTGMTRVGGIATAAGAAFTAPFIAALKTFSDTGSALNDMSMRTGIAGSKLAELGYAAEQSGSSLSEVEGGIRKMQRTLGAATEGSKAAREALSNLGISLAEIKDLSPDKQFELISEKIAAIQDPTKRAAAAMSIFGKSGTQLLPMIQDMAALTAEFRASGLGPTDEDIKNADALGDAFGKLVAFGKGLMFTIGAALAEEAMNALEAVSKVVVTVGRWVKENKALVVTIAKVAGVVALAGSAITGLGLTIAAAGIALGGIATAISFVLSPLVLVTSALAAGAFAWANYTESGKAAMSGLMGFLGPLLETFRTTFGGIADAVMSGDLALAGKIAMVGLRVALLQGVSAISTAVGGALGDFIGTIGAQIAGGDLTGAWKTVVSGMAELWFAFVESITATFTQAMRFIVDNAKRIETALAFLAPGVNVALDQFGGIPGAGGQEGADAFRSKLDQIDRDAQERTRSATSTRRARTRGGAQAIDPELAGLQAELAALREKAAEQRAQQAEQRSEQVAPTADTSGLKQAVFGSFSAAALAAQGGGGGPMDRVAKGVEKLVKLDEKHFLKLEQMHQELMAAGRLG